MNAQSLTLALGGRWNGRAGMARCVCHDDGTPSLSVRDGEVPGRIIFKCFAGCSGDDIVAELRRRGLLDGVSSQVDRKKVVQVAPPDHKPDPGALAIWREAKDGQVAHPFGASCAKRYLSNRGITIQIPPSVRSGTKLHLGRYELPTMIAAVQAPAGHIIALQTTLLKPNGEKANVSFPRLTTGSLGYGAVRLAKAAEKLGLAEGVETALSAMQLFDVPCWATLGAARMARVEIPQHVPELHIFADNDDPGKAAAEATDRAAMHLPLAVRPIERDS